MAESRDHHRVSPAGRQLGAVTARLAERGRTVLARGGVDLVAAEAIPDSSVRAEMCTSCACRPGGVPNGCLQTQMDLLKALVEGKPFLCHAPKNGKLCAGWLAARAAIVALGPMPPSVIEMVSGWEYSPPDENTDPEGGDHARQ